MYSYNRQAAADRALKDEAREAEIATNAGQDVLKRLAGAARMSIELESEMKGVAAVMTYVVVPLQKLSKSDDPQVKEKATKLLKDARDAVRKDDPEGSHKRFDAIARRLGWLKSHTKDRIHEKAVWDEHYSRR